MAAFVLSKKSTFHYLVKVRQPRESGKIEEFEFQGVFNRLPQDEIRKLMEAPPPDRERLDKVWVGWVKGPTGIKTMAKNGDGPEEIQVDLEDTEANRLLLLDKEPGFEAGVVKAWMEAAVFGPAKN